MNAMARELARPSVWHMRVEYSFSTGGTEERLLTATGRANPLPLRHAVPLREPARASPTIGHLTFFFSFNGQSTNAIAIDPSLKYLSVVWMTRRIQLPTSMIVCDLREVFESVNDTLQTTRSWFTLQLTCIDCPLDGSATIYKGVDLSNPSTAPQKRR